MVGGLGAVWTWVDLSPKVEGDFFFAADDPQLRASEELAQRFPGRSQVIVRAEDTQGDPTLYRDRVGALTEALSQAMTLSVDWFGLAVLAVWGAVAAGCALRWFRFT